jgi:serine/threonine protein phosphatase PrpC
VGTFGLPHDCADAALRCGVEAANAWLGAATGRGPSLSGMATTLTAVALDRWGRLVVAHVGDARAYLLRAGELVPLTRDHTFVQGLVDAGIITVEQARDHPLRSIVLRTLHGGENDPALVEWGVHQVRPGDRVLICSDGLSGVVASETLRVILAGEPSPSAAVASGLRAALVAGTSDNVTVVVADVTAVGPGTPAAPARVGAGA